MTDDAKQEVVNVSIRLLDDAYMAWFVAESDCEQALRAWFQAAGGRPDAYFAYRAALEREDAAARDLQRLVELTGSFHESVADGAREVIQ
jgi:hypothetical protein